MRKANVRAFDPHLCHLKRTLRSEVSEVLHGLLFRFAIPAKAFRAQRLGDRELCTDGFNQWRQGAVANDEGQFHMGFSGFVKLAEGDTASIWAFDVNDGEIGKYSAWSMVLVV